MCLCTARVCPIHSSESLGRECRDCCIKYGPEIFHFRIIHLYVHQRCGYKASRGMSNSTSPAIMRFRVQLLSIHPRAPFCLCCRSPTSHPSTTRSLPCAPLADFPRSYIHGGKLSHHIPGETAPFDPGLLWSCHLRTLFPSVPCLLVPTTLKPLAFFESGSHDSYVAR